MMCYTTKVLSCSHQNLLVLFLDNTFLFYKNTWFQFQPDVSYFSLNFQPKVFLILFLIFVSKLTEHSGVKQLISMVLNYFSHNKVA